TRKCSETRKRQPRSPSSSERCASTPATAFASNGSSPTTAAPTSPPDTHWPAARCASATAAPDPTGHKPTEKPNASSAPSSQAGPTARSTAQAQNAPKRLTAGSGTTTIADHTQPSATKPRQAEPTCSGPTPRRV